MMFSQATYKQFRAQQDALSNLEGSFAKHTELSLWLANHLFSAKHTKNLVLSPLSIHVVLSLLAAGSNGPTRDQLLAFIRSDSIEQVNSLSSKVVNLLFADGESLGGPCLSLANGVWLDHRLTPNPAFIDIAHNAYKAAVNQVDFMDKGAIQKVNRWVAKETNGLIKDILAAVDPLVTRFILANAVYFKGTWENKFDPSATKQGDFFLSDGTSIQVPFMSSCKSQSICVFDGFKVLNLGYRQCGDARRFSMCIFLPDSKDGVAGLLERMGSEPGFMEQHIPYSQVKVGDFRIPKFKIESDFEVGDFVKGQGVDLPFSPGGLTEMVESPGDDDDDMRDGKDLYVYSMMQKAFIQVDEHGTKAAVAFRLPGGCSKMDEALPIDFVADHPFIFLIREYLSGALLFIGQLLNPLAA